MKYVDLGGRQASAIGLGLWQFGSSQWGWGGHFNDAEATRMVHGALDLGVNVFDTAEIYSNGASEEIFGRALGTRRDEAIVATKVSPAHLTHDAVIAAADRSLARLGVDAIDLYQVHWPNRFVPISKTMRAMSKLLTAGKIKDVGVSNFDLGRWKSAESALGAPVIANQVQYNLIDQRPSNALVPHAQAGGRIILAYSPLAQGVLGGRYNASNTPADWRANDSQFSRESFQRVSPLLDAMDEIAKHHDATVSQIALAWLIHQPQVIAIPGARNLDQVKQNAAAAEIDLSQEEVARLTTLGRQAGYNPSGFSIKRIAAKVLGA